MSDARPPLPGRPGVPSGTPRRPTSGAPGTEEIRCLDEPRPGSPVTAADQDVADRPAGQRPGPEPRLELPYLDGLRGVAALVVALYHAYLSTGMRGDAYRDLGELGAVLGYGYLGVPVFIVLSGYVLMLPVVRDPGLRLSGGAVGYLRRRARRILPPYYAALLVSLLLIALVPVMQERSGTQWDTKLPVTPGGIASHLLLLHDLRPDWIGQINGPLWSIAVEWHIYFLMPLVLLPLWRRIPPGVVVAALLAASVLPPALGFDRVSHVHPWLVALFACGMLAAQATVRTDWRLRGLRTTTWVLGATGAFCLLLWWQPLHSRPWASETLAGVVVACALVLAGRRAQSGAPPGGAVAFLQTRPVMLLGLASYSIYLLHSPLLALVNLLTVGWGLPTWGQYLLMTFGAVPLALAACAGFYWLVERRFKNTHQRSVTAQPGAHRPTR